MTIRLYLILSCVMLMANANAEPIRLSSNQMDSVTAGAMSVTAFATANASGTISNTQTLTNTSVRSPGKNHAGVLIGRGTAQAYACCGPDASATATTAATADGRIVVARQINNRNTTSNSASAYSTIFIVSVTPPNH